MRFHERPRLVPNLSCRIDSALCAEVRDHRLRRTCAKLCRKNGGDLEQIKFLLGHSSIQTTERYLGSEQDMEIAVNDNLGL
jgi:integrase